MCWGWAILAVVVFAVLLEAGTPRGPRYNPADHEPG